MGRFWDASSPALFTAFSVSHYIVLVLTVLLLFAMYRLRFWLKEGRRAALGRYILAAILAICEITLNIWFVTEDVFSLKSTLPLELCSISLLLCIFMLLFRNRLVFQIVYFTGIGGAMQALLTPVLYYAFPHYLFLEFFIAHIAIIAAVLYMVWVEGFRPTLKSIGITMLFLNVMLVIVWSVNHWTGGNYMFVARKPETASLLDLLGPYPWYLLSMEAVAIVVFGLLYLPFARRHRPTSQKQKGT
ncbi:YwaF family protein [Paenibacillus koleovorans]|uniref:YwaF family protein n=1 Tax=Paenibacillus koleovorans TaxID=121608 RepID=UPI000FDCDA42|nr:TIGR02206 family membrane protein [Paenibacillus koleovorans]